MASRFIPAAGEKGSADQNDDWSRAREAVKASRENKVEEGKQAGGKSLYEVLQENKGGLTRKRDDSTVLM